MYTVHRPTYTAGLLVYVLPQCLERVFIKGSYLYLEHTEIENEPQSTLTGM